MSHRSWRLRSQEDSKISILFLESKGHSSKVVLRVKRKEKWGCPGLARKYPSDTWQFSWEHSGTLSTSYLRVWIFLSQNIKDCHSQDNSSGLIVTKFWFFSPCWWFPSISPRPSISGNALIAQKMLIWDIPAHFHGNAGSGPHSDGIKHSRSSSVFGMFQYQPSNLILNSNSICGNY